MAPPRKPPERRQRRGTSDLQVVAEVVPTVLVDGVPEPDREWLPEVAAEWTELWRSDLARRVEVVDHPAVRRLFEWRDEQYRARRRAKVLRAEAEKEATVVGSKGQPVANPLFATADAADAQALAIETRIVALEDRIGLSPKARLALGVTEQQGMNLAARNAQIAAAIREAMHGASDPRALPGDSAADAG